jgi:hypothetical protein
MPLPKLKLALGYLIILRAVSGSDHRRIIAVRIDPHQIGLTLFLAAFDVRQNMRSLMVYEKLLTNNHDRLANT